MCYEVVDMPHVLWLLRIQNNSPEEEEGEREREREGEGGRDQHATQTLEVQ